MPHRPKLSRTRRTLAVGALAVASLIVPARSIFGRAATGSAKPSQLARLVALQQPRRPETDHDLARLKLAHQRRQRRAFKRWSHAFRTLRGKYHVTLAELRRFMALHRELAHAHP